MFMINRKGKSIVMALAAVAASQVMATKSYANGDGAEIALGIAEIIAGAIASRRDRGYAYPVPVPVPVAPIDPYYYDPYAPYQYGNDPYGTYYRPYPGGPTQYRGGRIYEERDPGYRYRGHGGYKYDRTFDPRYRIK